MTTGQRIKQQRILFGLTADELAKKIGKDRSTIYRYENDEIEKLPSNVLVSLANALETTPAFLMGWENVEDEIEKNVNLFFMQKDSFIVTEAMKIFLLTADDSVKLKVLELLQKI